MKKARASCLFIGILFFILNFFVCLSSVFALAEDTVTITFWSIFPEGDDKRAAMDNLLREFENKNPGIKVIHYGYDFWDYSGKLTTAQAGGTQPDLAFDDFYSVKDRAKNGIIRSLDGFIEKYGMDMGILRSADKETFSYEGELYALPFSSDFRIIYYNKDHFKEVGLDPNVPPKTLDELIEYADKLDVWGTSKTGSKELLRCGFSPKLGDDTVFNYVWTVGGDFFTEDGMPNLLSDEVKKGVQNYVDVCNRYTNRQFNAFNTKAEQKIYDPFLTGMTSMEVNGDWFAWEIEKYFEEGKVEAFDWGVFGVPYEGENRGSYGNGFSLEISAKSSDEKAEASFKLIDFFMSEDVQERWTQLMRFTPSNMNVLNKMIENPETEDTIRNLMSEAEYKKTQDLVYELVEWQSYLFSEVEAAVVGTYTVEEALKVSQKNIENRILFARGESSDSVVDTFMVVFFAILISVTLVICVLVKNKED